MIKRIVKKLVPRVALAGLATLRNYRILSAAHGQFRSMLKRECIDGRGEPIPWYTYPAIEYLRQLDLLDKDVFEYGSGNSTLFWSQRCRRLVSVEDDERWYSRLSSGLPGNVEYRFQPAKQEYVESIAAHRKKFDVIIIDGSHRYECARGALPYLAEDGFVILDNSDWHEKTSALLRAADLLEVDMCGFGPLNGYAWTTSFYFSAAARPKPAKGRQPQHVIGSLPHREAAP